MAFSFFAYDQSGNLTQWATVGTGSASSSQREYSYDDADRLIAVVDKNPATNANQHKTEFIYDGMSRLRISREYSWSGTAWVVVTNSEKQGNDGFASEPHPAQQRYGLRRWRSDDADTGLVTRAE